MPEAHDETGWAYLVSNQGPLPCEGSALPLSYTPQQRVTLHGEPRGSAGQKSFRLIGRFRLETRTTGDPCLSALRDPEITHSDGGYRA